MTVQFPRESLEPAVGDAGLRELGTILDESQAVIQFAPTAPSSTPITSFST